MKTTGKDRASCEGSGVQRALVTSGRVCKSPEAERHLSRWRHSSQAGEAEQGEGSESVDGTERQGQIMPETPQLGPLMRLTLGFH